jgi:hypothetical protein
LLAFIWKKYAWLPASVFTALAATFAAAAFM